MKQIERVMVVNSLEEMCDLMCGAPEPDNDEHEFCLRCGRKLKTPENRMRGYGNICYKKVSSNIGKTKKLF